MLERSSEKKLSSHEEKEEDEAECDEAAHDEPVSPLPCRYPPDQRVDARHLTRRQCDPPVDACQRLVLEIEAVVDGIRLAEHAVRHVVAVIDARPFVQHVLCLGFGGIALAVLVDIGTDIGQEVGAIASLLELGSETGEVAFVGGELFA